MVRGIAHDPDFDHSRDSHPEDPVYSGARQHAADPDDRGHHGHCRLVALFAPRANARVRPVARSILATPFIDANLLRRADPIGQDVADPQEMALMRRTRHAARAAV